MLTSPLRNIRFIRADGTKSIRECYLSKTVGLLFCASTSAAFAHTGVPVPTTPPTPTHTNTVVQHSAPVVHPNQTTNTATSTSKSSGTNGGTQNSSSTNGQQLNLSSSSGNISASTLGNFHNITITVGGKSDVVSLTSKLTGAELAAADQVLTGSSQSLTLNSHGQAVSGSFNLNSQTLQPLGGLSSLTVPTNVKINDSLSTLSITGQLLNSGTIQALGGTTGSATIQAAAIVNNAGGIITTDGSAKSPTTLTLVTDSLTNAGTISATGNLNIGASSITNTGTLKSTGADVNFTSPNSITLQNTGGVVSAPGNINFRDPSYNGNSDVTILGGSLLSQQLNINTGTGASTLAAGNVTGQVSVTAGSSHVSTATPTLYLGNQSVSGDPTYYNQGNIVISGTVGVTNGVPLAIVASGNITSNGGVLDTAGDPDGGELTLVAGADFTTNDGSTIGSTINPYGPNWGTVLTLVNSPNVGAGSATGGLIDLTGGHGGGAPVTLISTIGTGANGNGGSVNMIAYAGSASGSGTITLPLSVVIDSTGQGTGANGNLNVIAGGVSSTGQAISMGSFSSSGGTSHGNFNTGNVLIIAAEPLVLGTSKGNENFPFQIVNGATIGAFTSGNAGPGSVNFGNITAQGSLTEQGTGNFVQSGSINIGGNASIANTGSLYQFAGTTFSASNISITASNTADFEGKMTAQAIGIQMNTTSANVFFSAPGSATASVNDATLSVSNAGVVNIGGTVSSALSSAFNNSVNIFLTGTGSLFSGGISLASPGTTQIGSTLAVANPNAWSISGTTIVLPYSSLTVVPVLGIGGTVDLSFASLQYSGQSTSPFSIFANGTTAGGIISITANTSVQQVIGATGANRFFMEATAGGATPDTGGSIYFSSAGTLLVNPSGISNSAADGGSITLASGSSMQVTGSLNTVGSAKIAGDISLSSGDPTNTFTIQTTSQPANGVFGSITGGNVTISDNVVLVGSSSFIQTDESSSSLLQGNLTVNTTQFTQSGTLVVSGGNVSVISPSTLVTNGLGTWSPVGLLTLSAAGGLLNVDTLLSSVPITYAGINLSSGNSLQLFVNSLTPTPGGSVGMTYSTITYPNMSTTPFTVTTTNTGSFDSGNGGPITITVNNGAQQVVGVSSNPGGNDFNLYANSTSGAGGWVIFSAGGNLIVNPTYLQNAGSTSGGNLSLSAGTSVQYLGSINQSGSKFAGDVAITSLNSGPFLVGGTASTPTPVNGTSGSITGGNVTISSNGIVVNSLVDSLTSLTTQTPGNILLNTALLTNSGALEVLSGLGNISVASSTTLFVNGNGTWSPANALAFTSSSNVNLGTLFSTVAASFHSLTITAPNQLALSTNSLIATPFTTGQGGTINITANTIGYGTPNSAPLLLSTASPDGGGTVALTLTGLNTLTLGSGANQIEIVTSPTTAGGSFSGNASVAVSNGGSLIANPSGMVLNTFNNAAVNTNLTLAGAGNVLITSWNPSNLEAQGSLNITSSSASTFTIGATPTIANGIITTTNVIGNTIQITSNSSGVAIQGTDFLAATAGTGSVTVTAQNNITGLTGVESISSPSITLNSITGTIGLVNAPLVINSPTALTLTAGTAAYVIDNSTSKLTEVNAVNTTTLQLVANGTSIDLPSGINATNIAVYTKNLSQDFGNIGNGLGPVTLNVGPTGLISQTAAVYPPYLVEGTTLAVTAGSTSGPYGGNDLWTQVSTITFGGTGGTIRNYQEFFPITLLQSSATGNLIIDTGGVVTITQAQGAQGTYTLNSWGTVNVDNNIVGGTAVTISTLSGPPTSSPNYGDSIVSAKIALVSDYGAFTNLNLVTPSLSITTLGPVAVNNNPAAAWTFNATTQYQSLSLVSDQPLTVSGTIGISNGNLLLADTGASLSLAANTVLGANNGNIVLEDLNTTSGTVTVGANSSISASATSSQLGFVFLSIGVPPSLSQLAPGITPPANVVISNQAPGAVFFGTTTNPNGTITANAPNNTLNAHGRDISFNNNGITNGITLAGGVVITADPPALTASSLVLPAGGLNVSAASLAPNTVGILSSGSIGSSNNQGNNPASVQPAALTLLNPGSLTSSAVSAAAFESSATASNSGLLNLLNTATAINIPASSLNSATLNAPPNLLNASIPASSLWVEPSAFNAPLAAPDSTNASEQEAGAVSDSRISTPALMDAPATLAPATTNGQGASPLQALVSKARKLHGSGTRKSAELSESKTQRLDMGVHFVSRDTDSAFETRFGRVELAAKSAALLCVTEKGLSVYNFHGPSAESVVVKTAGRMIRIVPGRHITVAPKKFTAFEDVNPAALIIPYRSVRSHELGADYRAFEGEFHVISAIKGVKPLREMASSCEHGKKQMMNRILKSAALMQMMSRSQEPFAFLAPPQLTAMNQ